MTAHRSVLRPLMVGTVDPSLRGTQLREAVYGTIVVLSVLSYLDEHPAGAGSAAATVAGSAGVLLVARCYAEVIGFLLDSGRVPDRREVARLFRRVWPVAAVAVPPLLLIGLAAVRLWSVNAALDAASLLGTVSLGAWGWAVGRAMHRARLAAPLTALACLVVGGVIVSMKAVTG